MKEPRHPDTGRFTPENEELSVEQVTLTFVSRETSALLVCDSFIVLSIMKWE